MAVDWLRSLAGGRRQDGGCNPWSTLYRAGLEIVTRPWCIAEYARSCGIDRAEYRVQRPCLLADFIHHVGSHGADNNGK